MSNNVIIFGAGASFDAGIPLLYGFVEKMWDISIRGSVHGRPVSPEDCTILSEAVSVIQGFDNFHGRVNFNDRNLEDIMSMLSFLQISGEEGAEEKIQKIIRAVSVTIELTCKVKFDPSKIYDKIEDYYMHFWERIIKRLSFTSDLPTIISFNYDLVFERSFCKLFNGDFYTNSKHTPPGSAFDIKYHYEKLPTISLDTGFISPVSTISSRKGITINNTPDRHKIDIDLLKLHGSLNFPQDEATSLTPHSFFNPTDAPFILPPTFNKLGREKGSQMWNKAFLELRKAKNIIIVGYSLPSTDIYMQYFLKSALGPNINLNQIYIFNPAIFREGAESEEMKERYAVCFSPQMQKRIIYKPNTIKVDLTKAGSSYLGSFAHFVDSIPQIMGPDMQDNILY